MLVHECALHLHNKKRAEYSSQQNRECEGESLPEEATARRLMYFSFIQTVHLKVYLRSCKWMSTKPLYKQGNVSSHAGLGMHSMYGELSEVIFVGRKVLESSAVFHILLDTIGAPLEVSAHGHC